VGYARVSTEQQDLTAQRIGLNVLGVGDDRIYVDHGLTGGWPWPPVELVTRWWLHKSIEPERPFAHRGIVAKHANQRSAEISADRVMRP
jgi:hypothetical protein